jgi:hypothetical protein
VGIAERQQESSERLDGIMRRAAHLAPQGQLP